MVTRETAILSREKVNLKHGPSRCRPLVERWVSGGRGSRRWEGSAEEDERQQKETSIPVWWVFVPGSVGPREAGRQGDKKRRSDVGVRIVLVQDPMATLLMKRLI